MRNTPVMEADEIAHAFNGAAERDYWKASIAGTRVLPCVHFNSRASMVQLQYYPSNGTFAVTFTKVASSFGDFAASIRRSLHQVCLALKAAGLDISAPVDTDDGTLRMEYDPKTKQTTVHLARLADDWREAEPLRFKVLEDIFASTEIQG